MAKLSMGRSSLAWTEMGRTEMMTTELDFSQLFSRADTRKCRARDGGWRQHTVPHTHFSQCSVHLSPHCTLDTHLCAWLEASRSFDVSSVKRFHPLTKSLLNISGLSASCFAPQSSQLQNPQILQLCLELKRTCVCDWQFLNVSFTASFRLSLKICAPDFSKCSGSRHLIVDPVFSTVISHCLMGVLFEESSTSIVTSHRSRVRIPSIRKLVFKRSNFRFFRTVRHWRLLLAHPTWKCSNSEDT